MQLEDTASAIWRTRHFPLALLVASRCTQMQLRGFSDEQRAPFIALSEALESWWPERSTSLGEIYDSHFVPCLEICGTDKRLEKRGMQGAYCQISTVMFRDQPKTLPADGFWDMGVDDFVAFIKLSTRTDSNLPSQQMGRRLERVLGTSRETWAECRAVADRIGWTHLGPGITKLPVDLKKIAQAVDSGAEYEFTELASMPALRVQFADGAQTMMLNEKRRSLLEPVLPWIFANN